MQLNNFKNILLYFEIKKKSILTQIEFFKYKFFYAKIY
jgi:hypothetical protein